MDAWEALLKTKGADKPCEACGNTRWATSPLNGFVPMADQHNNFVPDAGIVCVARMCSNCGLLRLHQADTLKPSNN